MTTTDADPDSPCLTCGTAFRGSYCPSCGQRRRKRLTFRRIVRETISDLFDIDRGFLHTLVALSRRPGAAVRDYVAGKTVRYTHPVKYLLVVTAVVTVAYLQVGGFDAQVRQLLGGLSDEASVELAPLIDVARRYFNAILIVTIPFLAIGSRVAFRRAGLNLAEHAVFNVYVYAHQSLVFLLFLPAFALYPDSPVVVAVYSGVITAYYVWACRGFFRVGWPSATLRAVGVGVFAWLATYVSLGAVFVIYASG